MVMIFDDNLTLTKTQFKQLMSLGVEQFLGYIYWNRHEPRFGKRRWDKLDKYFDVCGELGVNIIVRCPFGVPKYAPRKWYFKSKYYDLYESKSPIKAFSLWNADATKYTIAYLIELSSKYPHIEFTPMPGISGEVDFPVYDESVDEFDRMFWCYDECALEQFRARMRRKYGTLSNYNRLNNQNSKQWKNVIPADVKSLDVDIVDTYEWIMESVYNNWVTLYDAFRPYMKYDRTWISTVPRAGWADLYLDSALFDKDESINKFIGHMGQLGIHTNIFWYSIFNTGRLIPYHYWLIRKYKYDVWVGAETAANVVTSSERAIRAGCKGVLVGQPYSGIYAPNQIYTRVNGLEGNFTLKQSIVNIQKACTIWDDAKNKYR